MKLRHWMTSAACAILLAEPVTAAAAPPRAFFDNVGAAPVKSGTSPGVALAVVKDGVIIYEGGFGVANTTSNVPVTAETRFSVGSLSKQFTAAAILMLADNLKVRLTDTLSKYVPSLPDASGITIRMLLDQTSGLHNYPLLSEHPWRTSGPVATSDILRFLATDKPDFAPGTKWEYSNANYAALTAVAEKASGLPFSSFLRRRIFEPLHMTQTDFGFASQQRGGIAMGYSGGKAEDPPLTLDLYSGAGAVVSSAHDLALWDIALMAGVVLPRSDVSRMWRSGAATGQDSVRYTMGWVETQLARHREVWHNGLAGETGGYCYNAVFPDDHLAVVVLTNSADAEGQPERMVRQIAAAYGIGTLPSPKPSASAAPVEDAATHQVVRAFWDQLVHGNLDRSKLTPAFSAQLTPELLAKVQQTILHLGELRSFTFTGKSEGNGGTMFRYALSFANGSTRECNVMITPDGMIAGSGFAR